MVHSGPVGLAVVGSGYWGPNLIRNIATNEDTQLRWVCDLDGDRAARSTRGLPEVGVTTDMSTLLEDPTVAGVAITTPAATHASLAEQCLRYGKDVLVEKPLATTSSDGRHLVSLAAELGRILMTDHTFCYTPVVEHIHGLVSRGELGRLQYIDSVRVNLGIVQPDIDVLWDLAPHDLSIIDLLLGGRMPLAVSATGADPIGTGRDCIGYVSLALPDGAIAHLHANWLSPVKIRTMLVGGDRRTLLWDDTTPSQRLSVYDRGVDVSASATPETRRETLIAYRSGDMVAPSLPEREALASVIDEFATAIRTRRSPRTDGAAGLRVLMLLEAMDESRSRQGAFVEPGA